MMSRSSLFVLAVLALSLNAVRAEEPGLNTTQLQINEEAQKDKKETPEPVYSAIVQSADEVELENGDGDVATTGKCAADITAFCKDIKPGESRLSDCLNNQKEAETKGNADGRKLSEECKQEVQEFMESRATNINQDVVLATSCKEDASKFCDDDALYPEPGSVITCLREVEDKLSSVCKSQIFRTKKDAANDFTLDAMLHELCEDDAKALCEGVEGGEGRVQECLRKKRSSLSWDCQEELFRKEVEDAGNLNLNVVLTRLCSNDKKKFCKDTKPGMGLAKQCLEDHRNEAEFTPECKAKFEEMMARRASDFRLDARLRELCKVDIEDVCGYEKESLDSIAGYDGRVIQCLQDYKDELTIPGCKSQVHVLMERAAEDIRMDRPLADACYEDRQRLCSGVAPGSARVLRCLQTSRNELTYECRATLFDQEVRLAEDIDFKFPMKKACTKEIGLFCKDIPHGQARIITCLQSHDEDPEMTTECRNEVKRDEIRQAEDYRLNYRLNKACDAEIDMLCSDVCSPFQGEACGGTVIACLKDKAENITSDTCHKELFGVEKMESKDWRNDAVLKTACTDEVTKFCADIEPGSGRVHACLMQHQKELSPKCSEAEEKLNVIQSGNVLLRPGFTKACSEEMTVYCKGVKAGKGRMFRCLQANVAKVEFSASCKAQVEKKQARMAGNWKMDYGISHACKSEVDKLCADKKQKGHGNGAVMKCLVESHATLETPTCANEVSRAVRMALWQYRKGSAMTLACDEDAAKCPAAKGAGLIGLCLTKALNSAPGLTPGCKSLVTIAAPKNTKGEFDGNFAGVSLMQKVAALERQAGMKQTFVDTTGAGPSVTLTGWVALASIGALMIVVVGGIVYCYRKYTGNDKPYTLVVKGGDM